MANPPITIGPFTNVPAPGSPIKSDWPQQLTQYTVDVAAEVRTFVGAAAYQNSQAFGGASIATITLTTTLYDSGGFRGGDATRFTIPAGKGGTYGVLVYMTCTAALAADAWARLNAGTYTNVLYGYLPAGQRFVALSFTPLVMTAGEVITLELSNPDPNPQNFGARVWVARLAP